MTISCCLPSARWSFIYWDTVSQLFHLCAIIGQWLQSNISIPYPTWQHVVKSGNDSRVHYLSWTPHCQLELKTTNQKPRLKNVFVWNSFLIIHLHLTWVSMGTGARTSVRGRSWYPEFWDRPPRDTMWLVYGHGPWESQSPKVRIIQN